MKKFVLIILGVILFAGSAFALGVKVISVEGAVEVTPQETMKPQKPKVDMILSEGTKIVTKEKSSIELAFNSDATNVVKVSENTNVVLKLDGEDMIELIDGELFALLKALKKGETFQVRTPSAVCGARGTGWLVSEHGGVTNVATFENKVYVQGINADGTLMKKKYWVKKGYERKVERFKKPDRTEKIPKERFKEIKKEIKIRKIDKRDLNKKTPAKRKVFNDLVVLDKDLITDRLDTVDTKEDLLDKTDIIESREDLLDRIDTIEDREDITDKIEQIEDRQDIIDTRTTIIEKKEDVRETNTDAIRDVSDYKRIDNIRKTKPPIKK